MNLDSYANLKQEVIDWCHRDDMSLKIDTFIKLAETEMLNNNIEVLQTRDIESLVDFSTNTTDRFVSLPTGYKSMRKIRIQIDNGRSTKLELKTPSQLQILSTTGQPYFFTVTDKIEMERVSDQVYSGEIQYYKSFTALSSDNTTNSVLTNNPNIYLFGALHQLFLHAEDDVKAGKYYDKFINAIRGANNADKEGRYGVAPAMRIEGSTP